MSWNIFGRSAPKKSVISRTEEREFEKSVKNIEELDDVTRKLYKDVKKWIEANSAVSKSERRITQGLCSSGLGQVNDELKQQIEDWDQGVAKLENHTHDMNVSAQKTVVEPMKKFSSIFPNVQVAVKRREHLLQEFQKCQTKAEKYCEREKTGINRVKQETSKKLLNTAKDEFTNCNEALLEDIPKLCASRIEYIEPSFESLINSQVTYNTEAFKIYTELSIHLNGLAEISNEEYNDKIQKTLSEIKSLSITVDD